MNEHEIDPGAPEAPQDAIEAHDGSDAAGEASASDSGPGRAPEGTEPGSSSRDSTSDEAERQPASALIEDGTSEDDVLEATLGAPTLAAALEAVLLVTDQPIDVASLAALVRRPAAEVVERLEDLARDYTDAGRGFDLREVAGGWRFYTRTDSPIANP